MREIIRTLLILLLFVNSAGNIHSQIPVDSLCAQEADFVVDRNCVRAPSCREIGRMELENDSAFYFGIPYAVLDSGLLELEEEVRATFTRCKTGHNQRLECGTGMSHMGKLGKRVYKKNRPSCIFNDDKELLLVRQAYWLVFENRIIAESVRLRRNESYVVWIGTQKMYEFDEYLFPVRIDIR